MPTSQLVNCSRDTLDNSHGPWRTTRNVNINWNDSIERAFNHRAAAEDVSGGRATANCDHDLGIGQLFINGLQGGSCCTSDRSRNHEDIRVTRASLQLDSVLFYVISRRQAGDQLDVAAVASSSIEVEQKCRTLSSALDQPVEETVIFHASPPSTRGQIPAIKAARVSSTMDAPKATLLYRRSHGAGISEPHQKRAIARPYVATLSIALPARMTNSGTLAATVEKIRQWPGYPTVNGTPRTASAPTTNPTHGSGCWDASPRGFTMAAPSASGPDTLANSNALAIA